MVPERAYVTRRKYKCQICEEFARDTYPPVLRHIGEVHSFEPNFHVVCGLTLDSTQAPCPATYTKHGSFRSHVYTKHRQVMKLYSNSAVDEISTEEDREGSYSNAEVVDTTAVDSQHRTADNKFEESQLTRAAALSILKAMEVHHVSQVPYAYNNIYKFDLEG